MPQLKINIFADGNPPDTEYLIERSTDPNFASDVVTIRSWSTEMVFIDTVDTGSTFYYRTKARKAQAETLPSTQTPYSPPTSITTVPASPPNFRAINVTTNSISLAWEQPIGATSYTLKRDGVEIYKGANLSFQDKNLTHGTAYTYSIVATNASGSSMEINLTETTLVQTAGNFHVVNVTDQSVSLSWDEVTGASYKVSRGTTVIYTGPLISFTDEGLTPGTEYAYNLVTVVGTVESTPVVATAITTLSPPTNFKAANITTTELDLSWDAVIGPAVTYELKRGTDVLYTGTNRTFHDTARTAGTTYNYTVVAKTTKSTSSQTSVAVTMIPPAVVNFKTGTINENSIELSWDTTLGATSYEIKRNGTVVYTGASVTFTDTGLTDGTTYNYTVVAKNTAGTGASASLNATTLVSVVPPANLAATTTDTKVNLTWTSQGTGITYTVTRGTQTWDVTTNSFEETGLSPDTDYTYSVVAKKGTTTSGASTVTAKTKLPAPVLKIEDPALTPTSFTSSNVTDTSDTLTWTAVTGATLYTLKRGGVQIYSGTALTFNDTGLTPNTTYTYELFAEDATRISPPISCEVTTLAQVPSIGTISTVSAQGTLPWGANGGIGYWEDTGLQLMGGGMSFDFVITGGTPLTPARIETWTGVNAYVVISAKTSGNDITPADEQAMQNELYPLWTASTSFVDATSQSGYRDRVLRLNQGLDKWKISNPQILINDTSLVCSLKADVSFSVYDINVDVTTIPAELNGYLKFIATTAEGKTKLGGADETPWMKFTSIYT